MSIWSLPGCLVIGYSGKLVYNEAQWRGDAGKKGTTENTEDTKKSKILDGRLDFFIEIKTVPF